MQCVECGKDAPRLIDGACASCFVAKTDLIRLADSVDVETCAHCGARRIGSRWQDVEAGAPPAWAREDAVRDAVTVHERLESPLLQVDETEQDERNFHVTVEAEGLVSGVEVQARAATTVRQRKGVCDRCSRLMGDYFAAIIQLRATDRDVSEEETAAAHAVVAQELQRQQDAGNRFAFVTKDGPMHGGWDYFVGDIEAARQVCRLLKQRLGASVAESAKLVGRREGEDVHRVTFLVRIRLFARGDFALTVSGDLVQVQSISRGHAQCVRLLDHQKTRVKEADLKRLGGADAVHEAVLVSAGSSDLQVLDPVRLTTKDVPRPRGYDPAGDTVQVVRHRGRLYLVPAAGLIADKP